MEIRQVKKDILEQENILSDDVSVEDFSLDRFGIAVSYPGNFAVIFPVSKRNKKYALRVSRTPLKSNSDAVKYNLISNYFRTNSNPFKTFCDFKYIDKAVKSEGKVYPAILMDWADGKNLFNYIKEHHNNSNLISDLADNFLKLFKRFHLLGISHGDLHNSNIFINDSGRIKLIDYDSLFVKGYIELKHSIKGIESFIHPNKQKFLKEKQDFFPELVIYLSLIGISASPALWEKYNKGVDNLLFNLKDFKNYKTSDLIKSLDQLNDHKISSLVFILKKYLDTKDPYSLIPIEEELKSLENPIIHFSTDRSFVENTADRKIQLKWNAESFKSVKLNITDEILSNSGNLEFEINKATRITLSATTYLGEIKEEHIDIDIDKSPPSINKFISSKTVLLDESPANISWDINGASSIKIYKKSINDRIFNEFESDISDESGTKEIWVKEETVFKIEAISYFGIKTFEEFTQKVSKEAPKINLSLSKDVLIDRKPSKFSWEVQGAKSAEIDGKEIKNFKSSRSIWSHADKKIVLRAESCFGVFSEAEVELKVTRERPEIIQLESVSYAPPNSEIILSWQVEDRDTKVEITNIGEVSPVGQQKLVFQAQINYTLTANDPFGNKSAKMFTVNEIRPPSIDFTLPSPIFKVNSPKTNFKTPDISNFLDEHGQSEQLIELFSSDQSKLISDLQTRFSDFNIILREIQKKSNQALTQSLNKLTK